MASFEDAVTNSLSDNASAPPNATAPTPPPAPDISAPSPVSTAPANAPTLGARAAAPPRPAMQPAAPVQTEQNRTPGHFFKHLSHSFAGAILGSLAGPAPVDYSVDASGKTIATPRPDSTASRLRRIAESALIGLAAGSRVPSGPNAGAQWGKGIGAGAEDAIQRGQQQDLLKREQAKEDFEEQQKTTLHKATLAMTHAQTVATWHKILDDEDAKNSVYQMNNDAVNYWTKFINESPSDAKGLGIENSVSEHELKARQASDPHFSTTHLVLPTGRIDTGEEDADGKPIMEPRFAVISGLKDGRLPVPQSIADAAKYYSQYDARLKGTAQASGAMAPANSVLSAYKFILEDTGKEAVGWTTQGGAHVLKRADGTEAVVNGFTGKTREPLKADTTGTPNLDVLEKELDKGVAGDRAAQISAALGTVLRDPTASEKEKDRARVMKARADAQATAAINYAGRKAGAEAGLQGQQKMWDEGQNPYSGEKLNLSNAPDTMMVDRNGQPIPFKMLSTMKPTQQENNRADFAKSTLHILDIVDGLRQRGKLPNGPITGVTAKTLAKFGLGSNSQEAIDLIGFAQSASTGAHVGGRFNVPIMQKMDTMLNMNMNDEQFLAAEQGIRDVMQPYAESGGRITVGEYKHNLIGSVQVLKDGRRVKVTGFDKNGNIVGTQVR